MKHHKPTHECGVFAVALAESCLSNPEKQLGAVGGQELQITASGTEMRWVLSDLHDAWYRSIARAMQG